MVDWLTKELEKSRDVRSRQNKLQGLMNFNLRFDSEKSTEKHKNVKKLTGLIDKVNPRRQFRSGKIGLMDIKDPKRVHSALREFNDLSATRVYNHINEQIQMLLRSKEREEL